MRRKEKLLLTSNFSFSHNVFHSYISLVRQTTAFCGNGLKGENGLFFPVIVVINFKVIILSGMLCIGLFPSFFRLCEFYLLESV